MVSLVIGLVLVADVVVAAVSGCQRFWTPGGADVVAVAENLGREIGELPGVLTSHVDAEVVGCWRTRADGSGAFVDAEVAFAPGVEPDDAVAAVQRILGGIRALEFADVHPGFDLRFTRSGPSRGSWADRDTFRLQSRDWPLPDETPVDEFRAWMGLSTNYPGSTVLLLAGDGAWQRQVDVMLLGRAAPGDLARAFGALRGLSFPARDTMKWVVNAFPDPYDPMSFFSASSFVAVGSVPDEKVAEAMDSILGWWELVPLGADAEFVVTWNGMAEGTDPPHLAVRVILDLGEPAAADSAPQLGAAFLERLKAVGLPYALEVRVGDDEPFLVERLFR